MKKTLIEKLDSFAAAPFTIQRISELLSDPRKQYSRIDKFMRAVEKTILVVSTVPPGRHRSESENGDSLDSALNGDFATEVNVDIDMEQDASFTKELAVSPSRKEQNHEVSAVSQETVTITKNTASPKKEGETGASETATEKIKIEEEKPAEADKKEVETKPTAEVSPEAVAEPKTSENAKEVDSSLEAKPDSGSKMEGDVTKAELTVVPAAVPCEVTISEPKLDEALLNEPIRSAENEILVDTSEIISETTPLAALENIVAIRTEPVAEVTEQVAPVVIAEPAVEAATQVVEAVKEDEENEAKRLKMSDVTESSAESTKETVIAAELPAQVEPSTAEIEEVKDSAAIVEEASPAATIVDEQSIVVPLVEVAEVTPAPIAEEKIDEPLPEIAEIPIEIVPPTESSLTAMETTVPIITENTMSLDEDEPPTLELEMTPVASKMDTDEAEAAPMDCEDDAEPMDQ